MAFGNLKYQTQLPSFERFRTGLGQPEVEARGGSEEPAAWTALRAAQSDPLGAADKLRSMEYKKRRLGATNATDPYAALYQSELDGGF